MKTQHSCNNFLSTRHPLNYVKTLVETMKSDPLFTVKELGFLVKTENAENLFVNDHKLTKNTSGKNCWTCQECNLYTSYQPSVSNHKIIQSCSKFFDKCCEAPFYIYRRKHIFQESFFTAHPGLLDVFEYFQWQTSAATSNNAGTSC